MFAVYATHAAPDEPLQGRARQLGYFSFGHKYPLKAEVSKNTVAACNQCHEANAKKDDWVFSQYYPALRAAAPKSK